MVYILTRTSQTLTGVASCRKSFILCKNKFSLCFSLVYLNSKRALPRCSSVGREHVKKKVRLRFCHILATTLSRQNIKSEKGPAFFLGPAKGAADILSKCKKLLEVSFGRVPRSHLIISDILDISFVTCTHSM